MDQHKSKFGVDFTDNKKILDQVSIIRSKGLKNEVAGYITKLIKHEIHDKKVKEEQIAKQEKLTESNENPIETPAAPPKESAEPIQAETIEN